MNISNGDPKNGGPSWKQIAAAGSFVILLLTIVGMGVAWGMSWSAEKANNANARRDLQDEMKDGFAGIETIVGDTQRMAADHESRIEHIENSRYDVKFATSQAARNALANPGVRFADPENPGDFFFRPEDATQ